MFKFLVLSTLVIIAFLLVLPSALQTGRRLGLITKKVADDLEDEEPEEPEVIEVISVKDE